MLVPDVLSCLRKVTNVESVPLTSVFFVFFHQMTAEDLSSASADRSAERMMHQLHTSSRIARPPRPDPPVSARETFDRNQLEFQEHSNEEEFQEEERENKKHVTFAPPQDDYSKTKEVMALVSSMRAFQDAGRYLTSDERRHLRTMSCSGQNSFQRSIHMDPVSSMATSTVIAFLCGYVMATLLSTTSVSYRGASGTSSSLPPSTRKAVDRMMSYVH